MMNPQQVVEPDGTIYVINPVISPKLSTAATCAVPACESCLLGRAKKRSPGVSKAKHIPYKEGIIAREKYEVGDFVSTDKFIVYTPGRLLNGYGYKCRHNFCYGGTIYNDAASGLIWVENQVSLVANETVLGKSRF